MTTNIYQNISDYELREILRREPLSIRHVPAERITSDFVSLVLHLDRSSLRLIPKEAWNNYAIQYTFLDKDFQDLIDTSLATEEIIIEMLGQDSQVLRLIPQEQHTFKMCDYSVLHDFNTLSLIAPRFVIPVIEFALAPQQYNLGGRAKIRDIFARHLFDKASLLNSVCAHENSLSPKDKALKVLLSHFLEMEDATTVKNICVQSGFHDVYKHLFGLQEALQVFGKKSPAKRWITDDFEI